MDENMKRMNIVILSADSQPQFVGGVKRVTSILGNEWIKAGHKVVYFTFCNNEQRHNPIYSQFEGIRQIFISDTTHLCSPVNYELVGENIDKSNPTVILNPHVEDRPLSLFSIALTRELKAKLVQALHFHPNFNTNLIRYSFRNNRKFTNKSVKGKVILESLLLLKYWLYTRWHSQKSLRDYHTMLYANSDLFVVLSETFLPMLKSQIKDKNYSKLVAVNNPSYVHKSVTPVKKKVVLWCGRMDFSCKRIDWLLEI